MKCIPRQAGGTRHTKTWKDPRESFCSVWPGGLARPELRHH